MCGGAKSADDYCEASTGWLFWLYVAGIALVVVACLVVVATKKDD
jgi:hypothetical protein